MDGNIWNKFADEVWGTWFSIPVVIILSGVFECVCCANIIGALSKNIDGENDYYLSNNGIILIVVTIVLYIILDVLYILFVIKNNTVRKAPKGKIGILIQFEAENKKIYSDAVEKFGDVLKNSLYNSLEVISAPYYSKTIIYNDKSILSFLRKKRIVLFLSIKIHTDEILKTQSYEMNINASVIHREYEENIKKAFQKEFSLLLSNYRAIEFNTSDRIQKMRVTANEISLICEYIIGLSFFLNGDWFISEHIFKVLIEKMPLGERWNKMAASIQRLRFKMLMSFAGTLIDNYQKMYEDEKLVVEADRFLEEANSCFKNTYEYCLNKAYCYIIIKKDSRKAHEMINICQQIRNAPQTWRFSEAFLKAYDNKTVGSIISSYKRAFSIDYNVVEIIAYVETVLKKEPDREGLYLALGILYDVTNQDELAMQNLIIYIERTKDSEKAREILLKKGYRV